MSLERTNYGLSNEHLFYDVSFVVYCEGKKNDGNTHDEMFWSKVLSYFGIKCVCKSRGSKNEIVPLAHRAIQGGVKNVIFAMDRDYSDFHGFPIEDHRVIYTYGYSWENDILINLDVESVFSMFAAINTGDSVVEDLRGFLEAVAPCASDVASMDIQNALTSRPLFNRDKPVSIFCGDGENLRFNKVRIEEEFSRISLEEDMPSPPGINLDWLRVFYGKACARFIYQWFVDRSNSYNVRSKIPYDAFLRLCIARMEFRPEENARDSYYKATVRFLTV